MIANPHSAAGDELSILEIRSYVFRLPCAAGPDTGNQAAVHYKEVFCLPCFAYFVKRRRRLHLEIAEKTAQERAQAANRGSGDEELAYWSIECNRA